MLPASRLHCFVMLVARPSNCRDISLGTGYRLACESVLGTAVKAVGMVRISVIEIIGSQVLRAAMPMDAVHRLDVGRSSLRAGLEI